MFRFRQCPEIESAVDSILENEKPSVWSPSAATCVQHLVESCSIRGGLHDCHRIDSVIKLGESEAPSIRGKSKAERNTVGGKEFSARGTVPAHREHVMFAALDDALTVRTELRIRDGYRPDAAGRSSHNRLNPKRGRLKSVVIR